VILIIIPKDSTSLVNMSEIKELTINFLKILADQTRLDILNLIKEKEHTQEDLMTLLMKSQPTISQHLNLLKKNNLITYSKKENRKYYKINDNELFNLLRSINKFVIKNNKEKLRDLIDSDVFDVLF